MLEKFAEYQLLSKIATGGMAEIYLAKHTNSPVSSMPIAIKKILKQYSTNASFIKMFLSEARIICNISHENIVKIYDFGKVDGLYYIAMEYVFGQNLGTVMNKLQAKGKLLPIDIIIEISISVLHGLDHAHNTKDKNGMFLNVIHLDMNPNNILLSYDGKVKVVDFGIAHATYTKILKNNLESIQGTFGYLSPEQCREEELDRRSDLFSYGIILYEMLSGKPLFKHLESDAVIISNIVSGDIPDIRTVRPDVPPELAGVVMKALSKDRNRRYSTAAEMLEDIRKFQNSIEFSTDAANIPGLIKKEFASHFIKMSKVLEKAQAEYIMDELFKDIGELEEIDLNEKVRMRNDEESGLHKINHEKKKSLVPFIVTGAAIVVVLAAIALYFILGKEEPLERVLIFTSPPNAEIFVDGENTGKKTPNELKMKRGKRYIIEFRADNFTGGTNFTPSKSEQENTINMKLKEQ